MVSQRARPIGVNPEEGAVGSIVRGRDLSPPAVFQGREEELARLELLHDRLRIGLIYGVAGVGKSALAYAAACRWEHRVV